MFWKIFRLALLLLSIPFRITARIFRVWTKHHPASGLPRIITAFRTRFPSGDLFCGLWDHAFSRLDSSAAARRIFFGIVMPVLLLLTGNLAEWFCPVRTVTASYYEKGFVNRPTANGEIFRADALTAAHKTLPFHTMLKLHNPANGKTVRVRVNDRGPYIRGRELDLSRAAADALGMVREGVIPVEMRIVYRPD